jgi:hypothetical protein
VENERLRNWCKRDNIGVEKHLTSPRVYGGCCALRAVLTGELMRKEVESQGGFGSGLLRIVETVQVDAETPKHY